MRIHLFACAIAMGLLAAAGTIREAAAAERPGDRLALVIGNANYPDSDTPPKDAVKDAKALAEELKRANFDVDTGENLSGAAMRQAIDRLTAKIRTGSTVLVFFSGFGIQSARQSYLIPVDAQIWNEADVRREGISLESILGEINSRGAGVKIAILDASRRNPFERRFRNFSAGLAPVIAPSGSLVMYSAALSSVVGEGTGNRSLFVSELLKEIQIPGASAEEALNRTRVGVTRASNGEQVPWLSSSLAQDFAFSGNLGGDAAKEPPKAEAPPAAPAAGTVVASTAPAVEAKGEAKAVPVTPAAAAKPAAERPAEVAVLPQTQPTPAPAPVVAAPSLGDDPTIKALTNRLAANPNDQNSYYKRGQVYAAKGAYSLAIRDFDQAIRLNPGDVEAHNNRCWSYAVEGDLERALKDCNEALRLRPGFVDALDSRGLVQLKRGDARKAAADFDAALRINPRLTSSLYGRGIARKQSGATADGERDIANAKAMDPNIAREFEGYGIR